MINVSYLYTWKTLLAGSFILTGITACHSTGKDYDASGSFEAEEVMVSALQNGQLLWFSPREGDLLKEGTVVGQIDVSLVKLQKEQVEASIASLRDKTGSAEEQTRLIKQQLAVQQAQLNELLHEKTRTENLLKRDAATRKQLDDINAKITRLQKQMEVTRQQIRVSTSATATRNRGILSEKMPLEKYAAQYNELIGRGEVINPVEGTVLTQYAHKGEVAVLGKPLYKIAGLDTLWLRAYITGDQLPDIRIGQEVQVRVDNGENDYKSYPGTLTWIAAKAEFTPKAVQTKKERSGLVYAIKVRVKNDGYLKIGMYGELLFARQAKYGIK